MHAKGTKQVRESAAVSDCTKISCVRKVGVPRIRKLSAYEIFWIYSIPFFFFHYIRDRNHPLLLVPNSFPAVVRLVWALPMSVGHHLFQIFPPFFPRDVLLFSELSDSRRVFVVKSKSSWRACCSDFLNLTEFFSLHIYPLLLLSLSL